MVWMRRHQGIIGARGIGCVLVVVGIGIEVCWWAGFRGRAGAARKGDALVLVTAYEHSVSFYMSAEGYEHQDKSIPILDAVLRSSRKVLTLDVFPMSPKM
jgi:hypothetical protein